MEPLRKKDEKFDPQFEHEKFDPKYTVEKPVENPKSGEFSQPGAFKQEQPAEAYPEQEKAERLTVPMGPMPPVVPGKSEVQEPKTSRPQLVGKESKEPGESKKACFFTEGELREMRERWDKIQGEFVDQPRQAVEDADNLIGEAIKKLHEQFAEDRSSVIRQWNSGDNVSTEVLRQSLRRYRTFFDRLLAS